MSRMWLGLASLVAVLIVAMPAASHAHRMNAALTLIEVNPRTQRMEVSHTLFAHDAEGVLGAGAVTLVWFETLQGEQALRDYCLRMFTLSDVRRRPINLSFVGVELRGDVITVFFDAPRYRGTSVIVDSNLLQEASDSQINQVNLRANGRTVSEIFGAGASPKTMMIPRN